MRHRSTAELRAGLDEVRRSPADHGVVRLIVSRPAVDERETPTVATLDVIEGLIGDTWRARGSSRTPDGSANPEAQITVMNSRAAALVAVDDDRWKLAGDQIYADLDLSRANLPAGSRLRLGTAVIEISAKAHTGCVKFTGRFGLDALRFVNSEVGSALRLRGLNARVVTGGVVRVGDVICKEPEP
ncbi:MAG TPA: hypothetical protein VKA05_06780 [Acidimicrobiales bacterium]|nr:hypothetical protein [Acidimicrobiales bacterium]